MPRTMELYEENTLSIPLISTHVKLYVHDTKPRWENNFNKVSNLLIPHGKTCERIVSCNGIACNA